MTRTLEVLRSMALVLAFGVCGCNYGSDPLDGDEASRRVQGSVFKAAGKAPEEIAGSVNAYRDALGALNANNPGSLPNGRREINWDAVPALFTNTNDFPVDFFNQPVAGRARGTEFSTPGTGFRVSDVNFEDVNPNLIGQFLFFSPIRTFAAVGSNEMTVTFFVPGSDVAATSTGFGVVFSDVDRHNSATIRLFDAEGRNLGRFAAPPAPGGLSFVGVQFQTPIVARVEIESGQAAIDRNSTDVDDSDREGARDLVIMDDFIYGEPIAVSGETVPSITTVLEF